MAAQPRTFLPLAGVLVMLFIPRREETLVKGTAIVTGGGHAAGRHLHARAVRLRPGQQQQFFASTDWIRPIRATYTSVSTGSAFRSTCCRWSSRCW